MIQGILLKIASAFVFTLMSAAVKSLIHTYPVAEIVFFRSFFGVVVLIIWLIALREFPGSIATRRPFSHLGRVAAGTTGMFLGFSSLAFLPLADSTAIGYASPLMVVVLAAVFLGETVRIYRWSAVAVGFAGVLIMVRGHLVDVAELGVAGAPERSAAGVAIGLAAAGFAATATVQTRRLTQFEKTGAIVFYFSAFSALIGLAVMLGAAVYGVELPGGDVLATQNWITPTGRDLATLIVLGCLGGLGQILMTESFRRADASVIACFDYTSMLWALMIGILVFHEPATASVLTGAGIIAASGIFVIWRERRRGLIRTDVRRTTPTRTI